MDQLKGEAKIRWGKTDDEFDELKGNFDKDSRLTAGDTAMEEKGQKSIFFEKFK